MRLKDRDMVKARIAAALLAGALLASACGSNGAPQPKAGPEAANGVAAIAAEEEQWTRDFAAHDLERLVAHYAPDATLKISGMPPLTGSWIRRSVEAAVNDRALALSFVHDRIEVARSGDLGYSRGHYRLTQTDRRTGQPVTEYGTYLTVWQRQADGRWKALEDFNTPGPAPRPPM
jgi:ketosteroid isomerase-like protein